MEKPAKKGRILVIEDEELVRLMLLDMLEVEDFEAVGAQDGLIGLQKVEEEHPDLVICDIMMPNLNGFEVIAALRQNKTTASLPFIFLSARSEGSDREKGLELGANLYLRKPCSHLDLLKAVSTLLDKPVTSN